MIFEELGRESVNFRCIARADLLRMGNIRRDIMTDNRRQTDFQDALTYYGMRPYPVFRYALALIGRYWVDAVRYGPTLQIKTVPYVVQEKAGIFGQQIDALLGRPTEEGFGYAKSDGPHPFIYLSCRRGHPCGLLEIAARRAGLDQSVFLSLARHNIETMLTLDGRLVMPGRHLDPERLVRWTAERRAAAQL